MIIQRILQKSIIIQRTLNHTIPEDSAKSTVIQRVLNHTIPECSAKSIITQGPL
jgi:hypothetical protein